MVGYEGVYCKPEENCPEARLGLEARELLHEQLLLRVGHRVMKRRSVFSIGIVCDRPPAPCRNHLCVVRREGVLRLPEQLRHRPLRRCAAPRSADRGRSR